MYTFSFAQYELHDTKEAGQHVGNIRTIDRATLRVKRPTVFQQIGHAVSTLQETIGGLELAYRGLW